jgi:hypothetical protein
MTTGLLTFLMEASQFKAYLSALDGGKTKVTIPDTAFISNACDVNGCDLNCYSCGSGAINVQESNSYCLVMYNPCCAVGGADAATELCANDGDVDQCEDLSVTYSFGNGLQQGGGAPGVSCCPVGSGACGLSRGSSAGMAVVATAAAAAAALAGM